MSSLIERIEQLNLPKVKPLVMPELVLEAVARLGMTLEITSPSAPEQYKVRRISELSGYIRARHGGMQVSYPDAGGENLYDGAIDGYGGFTDYEREANPLFVLMLIAARILRG